MWKEYEIPHERGVCATSYANAFMFFERPSGVFFFGIDGVTAPAIQGGLVRHLRSFLWHVKAKKEYIGLT